MNISTDLMSLSTERKGLANFMNNTVDNFLNRYELKEINRIAAESPERLESAPHPGVSSFSSSPCLPYPSPPS